MTKMVMFVPGGGYLWLIRGGSFTLQVYERVEILPVEVYERVGKSKLSICKKPRV